jgi:transposase
MASITKQTVGNNTYLYESHSFRDERGRPRNRKTRIGKIDRKTGRAMYTQEYIEIMREAGTPLSIPETDRIDGLEERVSEALDSLKSYGLFYFLKKTGEKIKLIKILQQTLPRYWEELCMLSFYLIGSDKPLMYMEEWIKENECYPVGKMSSQRLSELLCAFGQKERNDFYRAWCQANSSDEYVALDITSISSYSRLITECEWGYNRDTETLRQINLCLLCGEKTNLPLYQTVYSGSLADASTFRATIAEMEAISGGQKLVLVTDKGFYSSKNVKMLAEKYPKNEFLMAVPFTNNWARELVRQERDSIDKAVNLIKTSGSPCRGVSRTIILYGLQLTAHIIYNPERALAERNELYSHVTWLKEMAESGKQMSAFRGDIDEYLTITKEKGICVQINQYAIERNLEISGWVVILGNGTLTAQKAHDIYRKKDVAEKAFMKYKNLLGLKRLRVHSDERMKNKLFVAFISLILVCYIHQVMKEKDLYRKMTMEKMFMALSKLTKVAINGHHILRPITKEQQLIFSAFSIPRPSVG